MLIDMIRPLEIQGSTLLDIGGGIGVIDQELLHAGVDRAVMVDAAPAFLDAARDEARDADQLERIDFVEGDFVRLAGGIDAADIVTLDRVVCCYPDAEALVGLSAARARRVYGLVLPRDRWILRAGIGLYNLTLRIRRKTYRAYVHPNAVIDRVVAASGLRPTSEGRTFVWRVVVYERAATAG